MQESRSEHQGIWAVEICYIAHSLSSLICRASNKVPFCIDMIGDIYFFFTMSEVAVVEHNCAAKIEPKLASLCILHWKYWALLCRFWRDALWHAFASV